MSLDYTEWVNRQITADVKDEQALTISWWNDPTELDPGLARKYFVDGILRAEEVRKKLTDRYRYLLNMGILPKNEREDKHEVALLFAELELEGLIPLGTYQKWCQDSENQES